MQAGRLEHRMAANVGARLETSDVPRVWENVSIENVSNHGARVITHQSWQPHDHVTLVGLIDDFHADAEVIYCQRLGGNRCAVGLRFVTAAVELQ
ncbi:MAG: PilZ domain-containing protein [Acidimicrobiales bacterium]